MKKKFEIPYIFDITLISKNIIGGEQIGNL